MINFKNILYAVGFIILIICSKPLNAQHICTDHKSCGLEAIRENAFTKVLPPQKFIKERQKGELKSDGPSINVNYTGFENEQDAQDAFQYAVDIWESILPMSVDIEIEASFEQLAPNVLGRAGPVGYRFNVDGAPIADTWMPTVIANAISRTDLDTDQPDIRARFNSDFDWYYGTDGETPANTYDFVTVVLHEIGHGLGISGYVDFNDGIDDTAIGGTNGDECQVQRDDGTFSGTVNHGCFGFPFSYNAYVESEDGTDVTTLDDPSLELGNALTNDLFWNSCETMEANDDNRPALYAPGTWDSGSSFSHLDDATFPEGDANSLMTHALNWAEAIHDPGPIVIAMLGDLGWGFENCTTGRTCRSDYYITEAHTDIATYIDATTSIISEVVVPNERLVHYNAGSTITLLPGFQAKLGCAFHAFIEGCDTSGEKIEEEASNKELSFLQNYPNPFTGQTTIEFKLSKDTPVTLFVSDVTGKKITVLLNNDEKTKGTHSVTFDGDNYPAGIYYYTIQAGEYYGTQKMVLAK